MSYPQNQVSVNPEKLVVEAFIWKTQGVNSTIAEIESLKQNTSQRPDSNTSPPLM